MISKLKSGCIAAVMSLGLMVGAADAATFTFGQGVDNQNSLNFGPIDGISLTVTSFGGTIHQGNNGLGVSGAPGQNRIGSNANINESLTFAFSPAVNLLEGIVLERASGVERFEILDSASSVLGTYNISGPGTSLVTLALNLTGEQFTFRHLSGQGIRVKELTVAAVPVPAAGLLLLTAIGGVAALRRRKKATAA